MFCFSGSVPENQVIFIAIARVHIEYLLKRGVGGGQYIISIVPKIQGGKM